MNLSMSGGGNYVDRHTVALVPTPSGTDSWKPVPHMEVIDAVTEVVKAHNWQILDENFGLAREVRRCSELCGSTKPTAPIGAGALVCETATIRALQSA